MILCVSAYAQPVLDPNPNSVVSLVSGAPNGTITMPPMSTTNPGDVIVFVTYHPVFGAGAANGAGLSFNQRTIEAASSKITIQYAYAHGTLTNAAIIGGQSGGPNTYVAFAVTGSTPGSPSSAFELNNYPNLPAFNASGVTPLTTTNAHDLLIEACHTSNANPTAGAGWTLVYGANNILVEVMPVTSTQSALTPLVGGGTTPTACTGDAVQQAFTVATAFNTGRQVAPGSLGTNIEFIYPGDPELPFMNILAQSATWATVNNSGVEQNQEDCIALDSNGYPTSLTAISGPNCSPQNWTRLTERVGGSGMQPPFYPGVQYTVIATGTASLTISGDATQTCTYTSVVLDTTCTFTPVPSTNGFTVTLTSEGNPYLSFLAIVPTTQVSAFLAGGQGTVNPDWASAFSQYCLIRGMDMTNTLSANGGDTQSVNWGYVRGKNYQAYGPYTAFQSTTGSRAPPTNAATAAGSNVLHFAAVPSWVTVGLSVSDLTTPNALTIFYSIVTAVTPTTVTLSNPAQNAGVGNGDAIYFNTLADSVPIASLVSLANSIGADLHINIPIGASLDNTESSDPFVTQEASLVLSTLHPDGIVIPEFSNEWWNNGKQQFYAGLQATALWAGTFTGSLSSGVLTVSSVPTNANLVSTQMTLTGTGITAGATVCTQITGVPGGIGTYHVDTNSNCNTANTDTVGSETINFADNGNGKYQWLGYRQAQVCRTWKNVWAAANPPQDFRVVCPLPGQLGNTGVESGAAACAAYNGLGAIGAGPCAGYGYQGIDLVMTAPYAGYQVPDGWLNLDPASNTTFTASASNYIMTVSSVSSGAIVPYMALTSGPSGLVADTLVLYQIDSTHWAINTANAFSSGTVTGIACAINCLTKLYQEFNVGGAMNQTQTGTVTQGSTTISGLSDTTMLTTNVGGPGMIVSDGGNCIPANTKVFALSTASFTASISGPNMTVTGFNTGAWASSTILIGGTISGNGVTGGTTITGQTGGTTGGTGTYTVSPSQTVASTTITENSNNTTIVMNTAATAGTSPNCSAGASETLTFTGPVGGIVGNVNGVSNDVGLANTLGLSLYAYEGGFAGLGGGSTNADTPNAVMSAAMQYQTTVQTTPYGNMVTSNKNYWTKMFASYKGGNHFTSIGYTSGQGNGDWGLAHDLGAMATSPKNLGVQAYIAAHRGRPPGYPCSAPRVGHH